MGSRPEPELDEIYREIILDHYRRPRNRGLVPDATVSAEGVNPICGDQLTLTLRLEGDTIAAVGFKGSGCAISQSSASLMTEAIRQRRLSDAARLKRAFEAMMIEGAAPTAELGDLEALQGVRKLPARVKCALLAWKVLGEALTERQGAATVTTEAEDDRSPAKG
ncbi:MAG: SUF system NifU family Fe-S cluster assembly protein [Chloroflexota bacterium]